jgi:hypothetical protein
MSKMPPTTRFQRLVYRTRAHPKDTQHKRTLRKPMVKRVRVQGVSIEDVRGLQPLSDGQVDADPDPKLLGAWRYKEGKVQRAGNDLDISKYYDHKSATGTDHVYSLKGPPLADRLPRRRHESNFFITINPNLGANTRSGEGDQDTLYATLNSVLAEISSEKSISSYLKYGPKHDVYKNDLYRDVVVSREWNAASETGPKKARVHAHIWLTLHHYSQVQINTKMLQYVVREHFNAFGGGEGRQLKGLPYVNVRLLPQSDWTMVMKSYIHKAMAQPQVVDSSI